MTKRKMKAELERIGVDMENVRDNIRDFAERIKRYPRQLGLAHVAENLRQEKLLLRRLQYRKNLLLNELEQVA